jgi:superfamily I DNA/RNA helicase
MSLWWTKKEQLDPDQIKLIEKVPLRSNALVLGSPGSGKTNVLVRRAQFVRGQNMPNVLLLTFTRPLTEFVKTGCVDPQGREIFPENCVTTLESWQRKLYALHQVALPDSLGLNLIQWKRNLAWGALPFAAQKRRPKYDALFVDEAQDLLEEEVNLLSTWSSVLFLVGDDRQRIYEHSEGLSAVRVAFPGIKEHVLPFHYRVAPEICQVADRILLPHGGDTLASTAHYNGPSPATVNIARSKLSKEEQLKKLTERLREQIRVYADLIKQGDRLGVIVARKNDRDLVFSHLEADTVLSGKSQILRAKEDSEDDYNPALAVDSPICILTLKGCKGLEFRAVHWLFADELSHYHNAEHYYTVVTRAKTSLDITYTDVLPEILARAHADPGVTPW